MSAGYDGSRGYGLKLAGTASPSGLASCLTTTAKAITIDTDAFPVDGSKGKPIAMVIRGVGGTLNLRLSSPNYPVPVGMTLADGTFSPALLLGELWQEGAIWIATGSGNSTIEYVITYQVNPDAGRR